MLRVISSSSLCIAMFITAHYSATSKKIKRNCDFLNVTFMSFISQFFYIKFLPSKLSLYLAIMTFSSDLTFSQFCIFPLNRKSKVNFFFPHSCQFILQFCLYLTIQCLSLSIVFNCSFLLFSRLPVYILQFCLYLTILSLYLEIQFISHN